MYEQIKTEVLGTGYVQMDETHIDYLSPGNGETKTGQLWACGNPHGGVFYTRQLSRGAGCVVKILPVDFGDHVQEEQLQIDNAMQPAALGCKNWLFIGEAKAGHRTTVSLTFIENRLQ